MKLTDKVAIVTGGNSGMGEATAELFAKEGARVCITARNEERCKKVVASIKAAGGEAMYVIGDIRFMDDCQKIVDATTEAFGIVDILFNNAGIYFAEDAVKSTELNWDLTVDINLKGTFLMSKCVLPAMIEQQSGVIINNSSGWGIDGGKDAVSYCASKGGVVLMTKAMAIDHGRQGIRVNCICPGDVYTPMLEQDAKDQGMDLEEYYELGADRPMGRIGTVDEIATVALFLASDDSSFVTGAILPVDGGGVAGTA